MTTLEDKINLFSKIVYDKINEEVQKELNQITEINEKKIQEEEEKLEKHMELEKRDIEKKARLKSNELVASESLKMHQEVLELRENLVKETMKEVEKQLIQFTSSNEYEQYLLNSVEALKVELKAKSYIMYLTKRDKEAFGNKIYNLIRQNGNDIEINEWKDEIIGGIIVEEKDGKVRIDDSLRSKLQGSKAEIGIKLSEKLNRR